MWTWTTTLALICAFFALQAEHPYIVQIKLRKNLKPRYLLWGVIYSAIALLKLLTVFGFKDWYCQAKFHSITIFETRFASVYIAIASISVLPAHLPPQ